jgi:RNA polymerase subunit RPABC4/transcription elongation factor Spt4
MDWDGCDGGGWGWGWIFPAVLVGRLIADAFERPARPAPAGAAPEPRNGGGPAPASAPAGAAPAAAGTVTCQHCASVVSQAFNFCPQCGQKLAPASCRYCGQILRPEMRFCGQCGGPRK